MLQNGHAVSKDSRRCCNGCEEKKTMVPQANGLPVAQRQPHSSAAGGCLSTHAPAEAGGGGV